VMKKRTIDTCTVTRGKCTGWLLAVATVWLRRLVGGGDRLVAAAGW
jgi:hypothetical protein